MSRHIIIRSMLGLLAVAMLWQGCDTRVPEPVAPEEVDYNLNLSSDRYLLYADHGRTMARITAQLLNEDGEPLQGATINFSTLQGVISGMVNTDISGRAVAFYNDNGLSGDSVMVVARYTDENTNTVRDTIYLTILPMEALVHNFFTGLDPVDGIVEVLDKVDSYFATVKSYIRDSSGVAVTNVAVNYKVLNNGSIGFLDNSVDSTDSQGISRIHFFNNPGDTGVVQIACYITGPELQAAMERNNTTYHFNPVLMKGTGAEAVAFTDTVLLHFKPLAAYTLTLSSNVDSIFADNGETTASIKAAMKTTDGRPIVNEQVNFSTTLGAIESPINTNNSGVAISTLTDVGPSDIGLAQVVARAEHPFYGSQRDTVNVRIRTIGESGQPWPYRIRVVSTRDTIFADNGNTIAIVQAVVKDAEDQPLESVQVQFTANKGVLTSPTSTNSAGVASTEFYSLGVVDDLGEAHVIARYTHPVHGTIRDTVSVYIASIGDSGQPWPYSIQVVSNRDTIFADHGNTIAKVSAVLKDAENEPIDSVNVQFTATRGVVTSPISTNNAGTAIADFYSMGVANDIGNAQVIARYAHPVHGNIRDTVSVYVAPNPEVEDQTPKWPCNIRIVTTKDTIYADNGNTVANVQAIVKDAEDQPLQSVMVRFTSTRGVLASPIATNNAGVASTDFFSVGAQTDTGDARIIARYTHPIHGNISDTLSIYIAPDQSEQGETPPWPCSIRLVSSRDTIFADNGNTIAEIHAVVKDAEDQPLDSVLVQFTATSGVLPSPVFTNNAGVAGTEFYSLGSLDDIGDSRIIARYTHPLHGIIRDTVYVYIAPNPVVLDHSPAFIDMVPEYEVLPPIGQDSVRTTRIFVTVTDTSGYPVDQGTLVEFTTTLGYITPFASTNTLGQVVSTFSMGTSAGVARIYAESNGIKDSCLVQIRSGIPTSITIPQPNPNHIVVQGGSGSESTQITAELRDANGQLVDLPYLVTFQIYGASPSGVRLNGQGLTASDSSNHGIAAVTLNSGTQSGGVRLRASVEVNSTIISASSNSVVIEAGPPYYIFPDYDPQNIADIGGGMYELEISARVQDYYTNPVEDSTHVYWYAVPNNAIDIIGTSYTNNENKGGDAYKGIAWTKAYYNSEVIFEQVQIIARTFDGDGNTIEMPLNYSTDSITIMPFVPGQLAVSANPSFWDFGTMGNPAFVGVTAVLTDVYNSAIPRGHIMFSGIGVSAWFDADGNPLDPPIVETDQNGMAVAIAQFDQTLCTPNFDSQGNVTSYTPFTAYVWGSLLEPQQITSEQASIELRRSIPE